MQSVSDARYPLRDRVTVPWEKCVILVGKTEVVMAGLIEELRRRNVFRVAVAYLALGWVVVQVTSLAVPALNLPETLNTIVFYLGLIGFPFAVFFAWAYELTPGGVRKTSQSDSPEVERPRSQRLNFLIIGLMAVGLAPAMLIGIIVKAFVQTGKHDEARQFMADTVQSYREGTFLRNVDIAYGFVALGDHEEAGRWIHRSLDLGEPNLLFYIGFMRGEDGFNRSVVFTDLLEQMNLTPKQ
jgi:hypothetical protein